MIYLFLDTETSGFVRKGAKIQDKQARLCQLGMMLTDDAGEEIANFSTLIRPDGQFEISEGAQGAHGFSTEYCQDHGIFIGTVMAAYHAFGQRADKIVAHNVEFDKQIMEIEEAYLAQEALPDLRDKWHCTMDQAKWIMKMPPTQKMVASGRSHWKNPKLAEALLFFTGRSLGDEAHDAWHDVVATRDIFFAMKDYEKTASDLAENAEDLAKESVSG